MKSLLFLILLIASTSMLAQITIQKADMPAVNDTFRYSTADPLSVTNPGATGANFTWNYSFLSHTGQYVDTFKSPLQTNFIYAALFFNADLAGTLAFNQNMGTVTLSEIYNFFNLTNAKFESMGFGAKINGIPTPVVFDAPDLIYTFPLTYNNMDSSTSSFDLSLPGLGSVFHTQTRINHADGWGTLITPFGTFNTLRVKSEINTRDSVGGFPFAVNSKTFEYKWLANGMDVPLMQINTTDNAGIETVTRVFYRDSVRIITSMPDLSFDEDLIAVYPNPATDRISLTLGSVTGNVSIEIFDINGKMTRQFSNQMTTGKNTFDLDLDEPAGIYFIKITTEEKVFIRKFVIQH